MVAMFAMAAPPSGWLRANGAAVSRTAYADLFSRIGGLYGGGDGATTFNLPDLRGEFMRGWDNGRGVDPGRGMGSGQDSQNLLHDHQASTSQDGEHRHNVSVAVDLGGKNTGPADEDAFFGDGLPHKPYIQTILPHGLSLPKVPKGDQVWQHSDLAQQRVDAGGNWLRSTDGRIRDESIDREVQSLINIEKHQSSTVDVDHHSTESVGGTKTLEALGALKLLSGGAASLAAIDDLSQATGRDLNLAVGRKLNSAVGGDLLERIKGSRKSIAAKTWLGSESVNVLQVLCDLIDLVIQTNTDIASHMHGSSPVPSNAAAFAAHAGTGVQLSGQMKPITGA